MIFQSWVPLFFTQMHCNLHNCMKWPCSRHCTGNINGSITFCKLYLFILHIRQYLLPYDCSESSVLDSPPLISDYFNVWSNLHFYKKLRQLVKPTFNVQALSVYQCFHSTVKLQSILPVSPHRGGLIYECIKILWYWLKQYNTDKVTVVTRPLWSTNAEIWKGQSCSYSEVLCHHTSASFHHII